MTQSITLQMPGRALWLMEAHARQDLISRLKNATPAAIEAAQVAALAYSERPTLKLAGDVAIIEACGPITYRRTWFSMYFGGATIEDLQTQFQMALSDPAVRMIVFKWHSPGGSVEMVPEFADAIFAARGQKPIVSVCDTMACSAAYWLATQADQVFVTGSSFVGSVGTYVVHEDISAMLERIGVKVTLIQHGERKTDGNEFEPLSDAARASYQLYADEIGLEFEAAVARGRGVSKKVVAESYGQGEAIRGKKAVSLGMADKVATFSAWLAKVTKSARAAGTAKDLLALAVSAAEDLGVEPVDGECPDGYELGEDGLCYLKPEEAASAEASAVDAAARDEAAILAALS